MNLKYNGMLTFKLWKIKKKALTKWWNTTPYLLNMGRSKWLTSTIYKSVIVPCVTFETRLNKAIQLLLGSLHWDINSGSSDSICKKCEYPKEPCWRDHVKKNAQGTQSWSPIVWVFQYQPGHMWMSLQLIAAPSLQATPGGTKWESEELS